MVRANRRGKLPELLDRIPADQEIASVTADGAFDTRNCYDAIAARGAAAFGHSFEPVEVMPSIPTNGCIV